MYYIAIDYRREAGKEPGAALAAGLKIKIARN